MIGGFYFYSARPLASLTLTTSQTEIGHKMPKLERPFIVALPPPPYSLSFSSSSSSTWQRAQQIRSFAPPSLALCFIEAVTAATITLHTRQQTKQHGERKRTRVSVLRSQHGCQGPVRRPWDLEGPSWRCWPSCRRGRQGSLSSPLLPLPFIAVRIDLSVDDVASTFLVMQAGYRHIDCARVYDNEKEVNWVSFPLFFDSSWVLNCLYSWKIINITDRRGVEGAILHRRRGSKWDVYHIQVVVCLHSASVLRHYFSFLWSGVVSKFQNLSKSFVLQASRYYFSWLQIDCKKMKEKFFSCRTAYNFSRL